MIDMTAEQRALYERLGQVAHFIRRRFQYQSSSMCTIDVQHAAWLKLMVGRHSDTLVREPMQLWAYAQSVVGSILEDWRKAKHTLKRGDGEVAVTLPVSSTGDDSVGSFVQVPDEGAQAEMDRTWAGAWLTRELNAFIEGESTATIKDAARRSTTARAYWLHFIAGCTHEEVAAILELPNKQVAWRYVDFVDRHLRRCAQREAEV